MTLEEFATSLEGIIGRPTVLRPFVCEGSPSLTDYERYRTAVREDEVALAAWRYQAETRCILRFERSFMRRVFEGEPHAT